jgi:aspartate kinase
MVGPVVLKFGGEGLRDGQAVRRAQRIILEHGGERPVVVVSAHEGVTDLLAEALHAPERWRSIWDRIRVQHRTLLRQLALDGELVDRHLHQLREVLEHLGRLELGAERTRDYVLSFGERMSARIVAASLRAGGRPAAPLDAFDLGLLDLRRTQDTRPTESNRAKLRGILASVPGVPVVTGFLASDRAGDLTTLGRSGSDLSAAWIGEALEASEIQLWKTVDGIMTADPRLVPAARRIDELGHDEAEELAACGARVLHPGVIEVVRRSGITLSLRNALDARASGTRLHARSRAQGPLALAQRGPLALLRAPREAGREPGAQLDELLRWLGGRGVGVLARSASESEIVLLVEEAEGLEDRARLPADRTNVERGLVAVAVIGPGVGADAAVSRELDRVAARLGLEARALPGPGRTRSQARLLPAERLLETLRALHRIWLEGNDALESAERPAADGRAGFA